MDSGIGRVVGVLTSPGRAFESLRERPAWVLPLVLLIVAGLASYTMISGKLDFEDVVRESILRSKPDAAEDEIQQAIDVYEKVGKPVSYVFLLVGTPIFLLLGALGVHVAGRLVAGEATFRQTWAVFTHAQMPQVVAALLSLPKILTTDEFDYESVQTGSVLPSNLGIFAPEEVGAGMLSLLSSIDVFSLWTVALLAIGCAVVGRIKTGTAATAVGVLWLLYIGGKAGWAALFG